MGAVLTLKNADFSPIKIGKLTKENITLANGGKYWVYSNNTFIRTAQTGWVNAIAGSDRVELPEGTDTVFGITAISVADSTVVKENTNVSCAIRMILFSDTNDVLLNNNNYVHITKILTKKAGLFLNNEYTAYVCEVAMPIPIGAKYLRVNGALDGVFTYNDRSNDHQGYGLELPILSSMIAE